MNEAARDHMLDGLVQDYTRLDLSTSDRVMLDYVAKLTRRPGEMTERDVAVLRDAGFDDRAIHDICAVTAYFAFVNRIADGLGVELEDREG
ncbi:MAG: peroxidase [Gemmatimonadales bacterium]|nr:peroxidase [Gemmatimonadales bacterium]